MPRPPFDAANSQFAVAQGNAGPNVTAIGNAQQALANAQKNVGSVGQQAAASLASDQTTLKNAQQSLDNAQKNLTATEQQVTAALAADQNAVQSAQNALLAQQATVTSGAPLQQQQLAQAQNALNSAQIARDAACNLSNHNNSQAGCNVANANCQHRADRRPNGAGADPADASPGIAVVGTQPRTPSKLHRTQQLPTAPSSNPPVWPPSRQ